MGDHESRDTKAGYLDQPFVARMVGQVCCDVSQTIVGDVKDRQQAPSVSFRPFTTKFDAVEPLLNLDHSRRTRMRVSVNAPRSFALKVVRQASWPACRLRAGWQRQAGGVSGAARLCGRTLRDVPGADLTIELITRRFTAGSKEVLTGWYPGSSLDMDEATRAQKRTKYGRTLSVSRMAPLFHQSADRSAR